MVAPVPVRGRSPQFAEVGAGRGISMASLRLVLGGAGEVEFVTGAIWPRNRLRMRLRWANNISTFFRSRLEVT